MYLIAIDEEFGTVAAPQGMADITGEAVDLFHFFGLRWNDEKGMFATPVADEIEGISLAVTLLVNLEILGHDVAGIALKG
ncbi:hypothetical protein [Streptomyces sp. NPDC021139]|uniref:hypothetical protein n=1 Tax=unclassified Streptomyces TaxID=2593676 RepID=UPI00340C573F